MADIFLTSDTRKLLKNKHIIFFGDSSKSFDCIVILKAKIIHRLILTSKKYVLFFRYIWLHLPDFNYYNQLIYVHNMCIIIIVIMQSRELIKMFKKFILYSYFVKEKLYLESSTYWHFKIKNESYQIHRSKLW